MGFWHTGYMEFHEQNEGWSTTEIVRTPPVFSCTECELTFSSMEDLEVHCFDGHVATRPFIMFRGRECGTAEGLVSGFC